MSGSGSAGWALRRLLAMSPGEVGLRAARAAREWRRRGRPALPQSEMASLSDVAGPPGEEPLDVQEIRDAIAEDRFSLLPGAEDPALLLERLEAAGGGLESVLTSAAGIAQGRLPAFGWTTIDAGRPIDWNRDPESGRPWPLDHWTRIDFRGEGGRGDPRYVWEVNRHHHLTTLARASLLTGDGDHATLAWRHMRSWIKANPPYHGVNWASALEVAIRLISWVSVADLSGCRDASDEEVDAVLTSVSLQADHVSDNLSVYASSKNNHLIGEAVGLLAVGTKFPMLAGAERWARLGSDVAVREITGQVTPGGASREQTFHYGTFVLEFALVALACLRRRGDGRAPALEERIARMAEFIAATGGPGGTPPSIGDEDGGRVLELSDAGVGRQAARAAAAAALMLGERPPDSTTPADLVPALWFVRDVDVGSAGSPRRVPDDAGGSRGGRPDVPMWYPEAGYFLGGAGAHHGVVDCGPLGYLSIAAHGHADCLSASLAYEREWYLVDPARSATTASRNGGITSGARWPTTRWRSTGPTSRRCWVRSCGGRGLPRTPPALRTTSCCSASRDGTTVTRGSRASSTGGPWCSGPPVTGCSSIVCWESGTTRFAARSSSLRGSHRRRAATCRSGATA